jgi:hypothetical protein
MTRKSKRNPEQEAKLAKYNELLWHVRVLDTSDLVSIIANGYWPGHAVWCNFENIIEASEMVKDELNRRLPFGYPDLYDLESRIRDLENR